MSRHCGRPDCLKYFSNHSGSFDVQTNTGIYYIQERPNWCHPINIVSYSTLLDTVEDLTVVSIQFFEWFRVLRCMDKCGGTLYIYKGGQTDVSAKRQHLSAAKWKMFVWCSHVRETYTGLRKTPRKFWITTITAYQVPSGTQLLKGFEPHVGEAPSEKSVILVSNEYTTK